MGELERGSPGGRALCQALESLGRFAEEYLTDERVDFLRASSECARELLDPESVARPLYFAADMLRLEARYSDALEVIEEALTVRGVGESRPWLLWQEVEVKRRLGSYREALQALEELDRELLAQSNEELAAMALGLRARICIELGLLGRAQPLVEKALTLAREWRDADRVGAWITDAYKDAANLSLVRQDNREAVQRVEELLADKVLYDDYPVARADLKVLQVHGLLYLEREDPSRPRRSQEVAQEALEEPRLPPQLKIDATMLLASSLIDARQFDAAQKALQQVRVLIADTGKGNQSSLSMALLSALETRLVIDRGGAGDAIHSSGMALHRAFEHLASQRRLLPLRKGGVSFLRNLTWREVISELIRFEILRDPTAGPQKGLDVLLQVEALGSVARRLDLPPLTSKEVIEQVIPAVGNSAYFFFAPHRSHGFVITEEQVHHEFLPPEPQVEVLALRHKAAAFTPIHSIAATDRDRHNEAERAMARELSARVLGPVEEHLRDATELVIVGDDLCEYLLWECLPFEQHSFLGTAIPFSRMPSFVLAQHFRSAGQHPSTQSLDLLLVTRPQPESSVISRWPQTQTLVLAPGTEQDLSSPYATTQVLLGAAATPQALLTSRLNETKVLQLLVHGVQDHPRERPAVLVLSAEQESLGLLGARELEESLHNGAPQLVMLTSCQSGSGPVRYGDPGATRLTTSWFLRGARHVIASPANLDADATVQLSKAFHARLAQGLPPATALRDARLDLITDGRTAPFYHGLLQIHGIDREPLFAPSETTSDDPTSPSNSRWAVLIVSGVLVGAFLGFVRRRSTSSPR